MSHRISGRNRYIYYTYMKSIQIDIKSFMYVSIPSFVPWKLWYTLWYPRRSRWWFQRFFIFIPTFGRFPIWLIFFRWVETTNQYGYFVVSFRRSTFPFRLDRGFLNATSGHWFFPWRSTSWKSAEDHWRRTGLENLSKHLTGCGF